MGQNVSREPAQARDGASLDSASQWSGSSSVSTGRDAVPLGVAPSIGAADFPFVPYLSRSECTRILGPSPAGSYVLFTDSHGRCNIALRQEDKLQRIRIVKTAAGVSMQLPAQEEPVFARLIDLLLHYSVEREGVPYRLAMPCFDFSSLRDDAPSTQPAVRNIDTIQEDSEIEELSEEPSIKRRFSVIVPDRRRSRPQSPGPEPAPSAAATHKALLQVSSSFPLLTTGALAPCFISVDKEFPTDLHDSYRWWRAQDFAGGDVDLWCHGPYLSRAFALAALRSYGGQDGSFLLRQCREFAAVPTTEELNTHELLILLKLECVSVPLHWNGSKFFVQADQVTAYKNMIQFDEDGVFDSLHHFVMCVEELLKQSGRALTRAVVVEHQSLRRETTLEKWYYPAMTREQTVRVLSACPVGTFVVRKDLNQRQNILSVVASNKIFEHKICSHEDLSWTINGVIVEGATSLSSLISILLAAKSFFPHRLLFYSPCPPPFSAQAPSFDRKPHHDISAPASPAMSRIKAAVTPGSPSSIASTSSSPTTSKSNTIRNARGRKRQIRSLKLVRRKGESWGITLRTVVGESGTVASGVLSGSPADCCGLRFGDVFLRISDRDVSNTSHAEVRHLLRSSYSVSAVVSSVALGPASASGTLDSRRSGLSQMTLSVQ